MKNVLIVLTVLAMATAANAALKISVNGVVDPPDTQVNILPSEVVIIDVHNVGAPILGTGIFISASGPGTLTVDKGTNNVNPGMPFIEMMPGVFFADCAKPNPDYRIPVGWVLDLMELHCDGLGDVTITIADAPMFGNVFDTQVIHQIPEPITFALLGLGGLFLRRRK